MARTDFPRTDSPRGVPPRPGRSEPTRSESTRSEPARREPPRSEADREAARILAAAEQRLADSAQFRCHSREVTLHFVGGVLALHGCVPSFYLKQVLQSVLAGIEGVDWIDNQVDVQSPRGLSSTRPR